jgi:hypothetical protein
MHHKSRRGRGLGTQRKIRRDNVGKDHFPAGARSNRRRPTDGGTTEGGGRALFWRMSPESQRGLGNAGSGSGTRYPLRGNTSRRRRGSRYMADTEGHPCRTCRAGGQGSTVRSVEPYSKPRGSGVDVGERLSLWRHGKAVRGQAMAANRTRENRLSGMTGGLAETWAMVKAIRAHNAETPKQTSLHLRLHAPHFYPDLQTSLTHRRN